MSRSLIVLPVEGLKDIGPAEESSDGAYQGMIIP